MGLILKTLFSTSATAQGDNKKTEGYSYDASLPSSPPVKGGHPFLGNGPNIIGNKVVQVSKLRHHVKRHVATSSGSTIESNGASSIEAPKFLHELENWNISSATLTNTKADRRRRSWENEIKWSRPTTSSSNISGAPQRPRTGYQQENQRKDFRHLDSLPNIVSSSTLKLYSIDLLDAHSIIHCSEKVIQDREQASGTRSYGEDVADRNMAPELPVKRLEIFTGTRPLIDSPELKYLKEMHLANKRAIGMIDTEVDEVSPSPHDFGTEKSFVHDHQGKKISHPHSHPLRSLLNSSSEVHRPARACSHSDQAQAQSSSQSLLSKPLPSIPLKSVLSENISKNNIVSFKKANRSISSSLNHTSSSLKPFPNLSILVSRDNITTAKDVQKCRRHTYSASAFDKKSSLLDQKSPLTPQYNSSFAKRPNSSSNEASHKKTSLECNRNVSNYKVLDLTNVIEGENTGKTQQDTFETEIFKRNQISQENDDDNPTFNYYDKAQKMSFLKRNSELVFVKKKNTLSANNNESNPKLEGATPPKDAVGEDNTNLELSRPKSRHGTLQKSNCYSITTTPAIHFDRNRSSDEVGKLSLEETQSSSASIDNEAAESPIIAIKREKGYFYEKFKHSSNRPSSTSKTVGSDVLNTSLPSTKNYIKDDPFLGNQYVWHLRPIIEDVQVKGHLNSTYNSENFFDKKESSSPYYYSSSDDDEFCTSGQKFSGPNEEDLLFREDSFGSAFGGMLPGLRTLHVFPEPQSAILHKN